MGDSGGDYARMLCMNVTHECYAPMLHINVEMNMSGRGTRKTQNCSLGGGDHYWPSFTSYHLVPLPEITKMAIIIHRVNIDGSLSRWFSLMCFRWFSLVCSRWLSFQMVQFDVFQFDVFQMPSRMADIMLKLKIDPKLVEFSFGCKSLCWLGVIIAIFVISGNGCHPRWLTKLYLVKYGNQLWSPPHKMQFWVFLSFPSSPLPHVCFNIDA